MTSPVVKILNSTAQLTPSGILGYAKGIAVTVGAVLTAVAEVIPEDQTWKRYLQAGILVCTIIATIAIPNGIKEVQVVDPPLPPPAPQPDEEEDPPGRHEAPPVVLGVIDPPQDPNRPVD